MEVNAVIASYLTQRPKPPLLKGAGVRWTPLHFNAEAPTEPAGETVGFCLQKDGGILSLIISLTILITLYIKDIIWTS